ncbi:MAG: methyl-accepting chemotaxis protein [Salinisphaera sp.]|nr:methyl-accepting chemotaxis protein [Salinisphaera sp.]MDN5937903.1 methyl-accepting chemotaxis protein [Salinisphaera sp.]
MAITATQPQPARRAAWLCLCLTALGLGVVTWDALSGFPVASTAVISLAVAGYAGLLGLAFWLTVDRAQRTRRSQEDAARRRREQEAVLRLLDDMSALAGGDLTVEAQVTEDTTGAIADSLNYSIHALRGLVATIDLAAGQMADASERSASVAQRVIHVSMEQAERLRDSLGAVRTLLDSVQAVAEDARVAAQGTERSVAAARTGSDAVRRGVERMAAIREQILETSASITRLAESSGQIGRIIALLEELAEQTRILALNAAIQAAMAGSAGRGFAVVADEVQALAEHAGEAARQAAPLLEAIRGDADRAAASMRKTTEEVTGGTRLAENAGAALAQIEAVARDTVELVAAITQRTREQTHEARQVSATLDALHDGTEQAARGTEETGRAIARLADLGAGLRASVSGFNLPRSE